MNITFEQIITVLSLLAALLAWFSKIRWSKEYRLAKDEIIKSKEAQIIELSNRISLYKDMTPMKNHGIL